MPTVCSRHFQFSCCSSHVTERLVSVERSCISHGTRQSSSHAPSASAAACGHGPSSSSYPRPLSVDSRRQPGHAFWYSGSTQSVPNVHSMTAFSRVERSASRSEPCSCASSAQPHASRCITQKIRIDHLISSIFW